MYIYIHAHTYTVLGLRQGYGEVRLVCESTHLLGRNRVGMTEAPAAFPLMSGKRGRANGGHESACA